MQRNIKIVWIASAGRSGSTILERTIGEINGISAVGEYGVPIFNLYSDKTKCSCGKRFNSCLIWSKIIQELNLSKFEKKKYVLKNFFSKRKEFLHILLTPKSNMSVEFKWYLSIEKRRLFLMQKYFKSKILIDSTVNPFFYGYYLSLIDGVDLSIIHLKRDLIKYVKSKVKNKYFPNSNKVWSTKEHWLLVIFSWIRKNFIIWFFYRVLRKDKYLKIRFNNFCDNPNKVLNEICNFIEIKFKNNIVGKNGYIKFSDSHMVWGNIDFLKHEDIIRK